MKFFFSKQLIAAALAAAIWFSGSVVFAAQPTAKAPTKHAYSPTGRVWGDDGVYYFYYGLSPRLYYKNRGFSGTKGVQAQNPFAGMFAEGPFLTNNDFFGVDQFVP